MEVTVHRKKSWWRRLFRAVGTWMLRVAAEESSVMLLPGTGVFVRR